MPLAVAAPAAVASLAYLNARTQFSADYNLLFALLVSTVKESLSEKRDRVNLFYTLEQHATAKKTANSPSVVYEGRSWTYKEFYDTVLKYAAWLKQRYSIAPKEIVAMDFMNSPQFLFMWLALWSLGAHPAFINYNLTGNPLLHCIRVSTARIIFVDVEVKSSFSSEVADAVASQDFRDGKGPVEVVFFDHDIEQQILSTEGHREPDSSRSGAVGHEMANLIYTSGTTGLPKPAIVSWNKGLIGGGFVSGWLGMKRTDRFYTVSSSLPLPVRSPVFHVRHLTSPLQCMPLYHSSAAILGFCSCLVVGNTFILGHKFSTRTFWPEVRASNATIIQYVGETCRYLLAAPPQIDPVTGENLDAKNHVRMAFGNGLRPDIWNRFKQRFGIDTIGEFYAATEGTSGAWNLSSNDFSSGAVGRNGAIASALLGSQLAIVELDWETEQPLRVPNPENPKLDNLCRKVPRGEPGELLYKLDPADIRKKFQGYFNNEKASESKIMRDVLVKGDAWFRTGDVMRWDKEGRWWFCDRIGDTFRWKSENVSTSEVSEALGTHPSVHEANVYGVELPNHDGRAGCASVLFDGNVSVDARLLGSVADHVKGILPRYAVPLFLRVTTEMQATGNNKQQKHVLRIEGVDPERVRGSGSGRDRLFWLKDGTYVEFSAGDWEAMRGGRVKL